MKKNLLFFALINIIIALQPLASKPVLSQGKYLIATLYDAGSGTVCLGNSTYQLAYNAEKNVENAVETDYWIINNINGNQYTFQNASTKKYIKYDATAADRSALILVDNLQTDNSTSFTLELKQTNNQCYYLIRSVTNTTKLWNRRVTAYSSVYPVGVYAGPGADIEQFIFYDSSGNSVTDDGKAAIVLPKSSRSLGAFNSYLNNLTFNGKTPAVDTSKKGFYVSLPDSSLPSTLSMKVKFSVKNSAHKLYINNVDVTSDNTFNFGSITSSSTVKIEIRNGTTTVLASGTIYFTSLPMVQLYSDANIGTVYSLCRIAVTEPEKLDSSEIILTNLKIRGAYSSMSSIPKKAYAIKLKDQDGETSLDRSFFGLRNDNNWILDAMYVDPGRMRNRVSTDLWNDFSTKPYWSTSEPNLRNGTRGHFVEVFLNDSYNGLYCMTEKVDRKQLGLKKLKYSADSTIITQRGASFKADDWSASTLMGNGSYDGYSGIPFYDNSYETWSAYECKYPDMGDGEPIDWKSLYDAVYATSYLTNDANFKTQIPTMFDIPVYIDYYLFIELLLAADNQGKNTFLSIYDQSVSKKISITPWDLDATWGRRWDGSSNVTYAAQNFDTFVINNEHGQSNLFLRLKSLNLDNYTTKLKDRYKQLRGNHFSYNNLINHFQNYCNLFNKSGAGTREKTRWSITDINNEMSFVSSWITARLAYLDNQYLGAPYTDVLELRNNSIQFMPNPTTDYLTINNLQPSERVTIYSTQGIVMYSATSFESELKVDMREYPAGIYIIKVGEKTAKVIKK